MFREMRRKRQELEERDCIEMHELCHTIEMNHSERFWALMDKVTDNKAKALRAELKGISINSW